MAKREIRQWGDLVGGMSLDEDGGAGGIGRILPLGQISPNPDQARKEFDEEALEELAASIKEQGLLQPILVRQAGPDHYQIVAGERRFRAAQMAGLTEIPAIVREMTAVQAYAAMAAENLQRRDLTPLEEVESLARLREVAGGPLADLQRLTGKSRNWIWRRLSIADNELEMEMLKDGWSIDKIISQRPKERPMSQSVTQIEPAPGGQAPDGPDPVPPAQMSQSVTSFEVFEQRLAPLLGEPPLEALEELARRVWGMSQTVTSAPGAVGDASEEEQMRLLTLFSGIETRLTELREVARGGGPAAGHARELLETVALGVREFLK